jgi:Spy/CpxP family protein refolding chaperone
MKIATRALAGLCLAAVVAAGPATAGQNTPAPEQPKPHQQAQGQDPDRRIWWKHPETVKELVLTQRQADKIERIWKANSPSLSALHTELRGLEAEFNRLMKENKAEERVIALQIDRVEAVRSQINKTRTLMLYRMHQVLTPEQYQKLTDLLERYRKERGRR